MTYYQAVKVKIHFNIILSIYSCLQNGLFPSRFLTKILQVYFLSHVHLYMTAKRHLQGHVFVLQYLQHKHGVLILTMMDHIHNKQHIIIIPLCPGASAGK
jgi:hypothetical protein